MKNHALASSEPVQPTGLCQRPLCARPCADISHPKQYCSSTMTLIFPILSLCYQWRHPAWERSYNLWAKKQGLILEYYIAEPMTIIITRYFTFLKLFYFIFLSYFASFIIPLMLCCSFIWFLLNKRIESPLSTFLPWQIFLKLTNILVEFCIPW